jgi:glycosyltransferase involved in cell wall biosynthesis
VLRRLAGQASVTVIARRVIPQPVIAIYQKVVPRHLRHSLHQKLRELRRRILKLPTPTVKHFRTMVSATIPVDPVPGRVVIACGSLRPGGAERQVANTLVGLARSGSPDIESLTLLCDFLHRDANDQYDFYLPLVRKSGATVRLIRKGNGRQIKSMPVGFQRVKNQLDPSLIADVANLYWEFRSLRPQVVHAWLDWQNVRAGLAAVLAGVPRIILSGRNLSPQHFALNTDYFHPAYCALCECEQNQVILLNNSQAGANDYAAWLSIPAERIKVSRNSVEFSEAMRPAHEHTAALRARLRIPVGAPVVGGMFRFNDEKRPLLWLQAAAQIAQALPEAHFVLFGDGDMRSQMASVTRELKIEMRTHLEYNIDPSLEGLAVCDLILLTSRAEGTPNVLLEAQWLGLPVVTTVAGGAAEALKDGVTGRVIQQAEAVVIADAVVKILRDRKFREAARKEGPAFIAANYGMERMIRETLAVYDLGSESLKSLHGCADAPLRAAVGTSI